MSLFKTMEKFKKECIDRNKKLLKSAEEDYERAFNRAITSIIHAYADFVCYGEKEVWFGDMFMEGDIRHAIEAEKNYNACKELYDQAMDL